MLWNTTLFLYNIIMIIIVNISILHCPGAGNDRLVIPRLNTVGWALEIINRSSEWKYFNPLTAKLFDLNFHPLEVVYCWRDPQLQVSEIIQIWQNGGQLFSNLAGWCHILSLTYLKCGT